jgi:predicted amidohydrolase
MTILAAALQLGPASTTIRQTVERILVLIDSAAKQGVTLAGLPELALTPYFAAQVHSDLDAYTSLEQNQWAIDTIGAALKSAKMACSVPFAEIKGQAIYNSMAFIDAKGKRIGTFRKMHIPGQVEPKEDGSMTILEKRYFAPGDLGFGVFDAGSVRIGGLICYDRRFPEAYRSLANNGADVMCVGYNTPVMGGGTLAGARRASELAMCGGAYSTATHIIGTGKAGTEGKVRYIGGSLIIGPDGVILNKAKTNGDEVVLAEIDLEKQAKVRERWNFEVNRRPADYVMTAAG